MGEMTEATPSKKTHLCPVPGCSVRVLNKLLMCGKHWRLVPKELQYEIWEHYKPGQEKRGDQTEAYFHAAAAAVLAVREKEIAK